MLLISYEKMTQIYFLQYIYGTFNIFITQELFKLIFHKICIIKIIERCYLISHFDQNSLIIYYF